MAPSSYDPNDIKITGYLQTQFQKEQSPEITFFSGGDFPANVIYTKALKPVITIPWSGFGIS